MPVRIMWLRFIACRRISLSGFADLLLWTLHKEKGPAQGFCDEPIGLALLIILAYLACLVCKLRNIHSRLAI